MFSFIKKSLQKIYSHITSKLASLFGRTTIDEQTLQELEVLLISADTGMRTTRYIMDALRNKLTYNPEMKGSQLQHELGLILTDILQKPSITNESSIYLLVGINGSGKTTFASKLAYREKQRGKKVLMVAADTFRAAAPEQLKKWADKTGATIHLGTAGQDPASVVFSGCEQFKKNHFDTLIIDTAGRLQTKINLMNELSKIKRIISKQFPDTSITTILTIDSMLGQNSFEQARLFQESTDVSGIVLTKMDGTAKGGIVFGIAHELNIPVMYISFGEHPDALKAFDSTLYVHELLHN